MRLNKAAQLFVAAVLLNGCASAADLARINARYDAARQQWGCDETPARDVEACYIIEANRRHETQMANRFFSMWRGGQTGGTSAATFVYIVP